MGYKKYKKSVFHCGKKFKVSLRDDLKTKKKKLRLFNKCMKNKLKK